VSGAVPAAVTVNVAVCPAVTVWFAGCVVIVGAADAAVAVPASEIVDVGASGSLLVIVIAPELLPTIVGEYVKFRVTLAPGMIVLGVVMPETQNGPPLTPIMEIVRFEPPTLLTAAVPVPVLPTVAVPKLRLGGFTLICWGAGIAVPESATCCETPASVATVRVPVTLPEELGSNET